VAQVRIPDPPPPGAVASFAPEFGQRFILTVDTEEEFDWGQPLRREGHSLEAVPRLAKFQQFCEGHGVVPIYLVDYPVATSAEAIAVLKPAVAAGKAEIGIQLHPWVNPPFEEEVNQFNSFAGNLAEPLERAKLMLLRDTIERNFSVPPQIYRAGRYGVGPNTAAILADAGVRIDTSVRTNFDYSYGGGGNFRHHRLDPYWLDRERGLLELPLTTVFWGPLRQIGSWLYPRLWRAPWLRGALSYLGLMERIPLTPEGVTVEEALRGIDIAVDSGLPVLVFSFHSPSLAPGYSPYVRSEADLDALYDWWRAAFAVLDRRGVKPASLREVLAAVTLATAPPPS
jgi:hypothetical protein